MVVPTGKCITEHCRKTITMLNITYNLRLVCITSNFVILIVFLFTRNDHQAPQVKQARAYIESIFVDLGAHQATVRGDDDCIHKEDKPIFESAAVMAVGINKGRQYFPLYSHLLNQLFFVTDSRHSRRNCNSHQMCIQWSTS